MSAHEFFFRSSGSIVDSLWLCPPNHLDAAEYIMVVSLPFFLLCKSDHGQAAISVLALYKKLTRTPSTVSVIIQNLANMQKNPCCENAVHDALKSNKGVSIFLSS